MHYVQITKLNNLLVYKFRSHVYAVLDKTELRQKRELLWSKYKLLVM